MPKVMPFKGILYNPDIVGKVDDVVTPPYDVISPEEREGFFQRHPKNVIRLILPKEEEGRSAHQVSGALFRKMLEEGTLQKDPAGAYYLCATDFSANGKDYTRLGVIACVELEPFDTGGIKPHEKTFSKVKSERLGLMREARANYSPIFTLFPDAGGMVFKTMEKLAATNDPDLEIVDCKGEKHRLWKVANPAIQDTLKAGLEKDSFFIADGHHRYETALNYKNWLEEKQGGLSPAHPARYIMMYLNSMDDPGLKILAAHRMLRTLPAERKSTFLKDMEKYFQVKKMDFSVSDLEQVKGAFMERLEQAFPKTAIGIVLNEGVWFCELKSGVMDKLFGKKIIPALRNLDVTVLTNLVFIHILGLEQENLDDATFITYSTEPDQVAKKVLSGEVEAGFLINPTRIEHVRDVADSGEVMPRKSTYFYPKVITGLVMNDLKQDGDK